MGDVVLFPQLRRRGHARHLVEVAGRMNTERWRQWYWRQRKATLVRHMRRAGFGELETWDALEALRLLIRVEAGLMERRAKAEAEAVAEAPRLKRAAGRKARRDTLRKPPFTWPGDAALRRPAVARDEGFRLRRWRRLAPPCGGSFFGFRKKPRVGRSAVFERFPRFRVHCSASQSAKG